MTHASQYTHFVLVEHERAGLVDRASAPPACRPPCTARSRRKHPRPGRCRLRPGWTVDTLCDEERDALPRWRSFSPRTSSSMRPCWPGWICALRMLGVRSKSFTRWYVIGLSRLARREREVESSARHLDRLLGADLERLEALLAGLRKRLQRRGQDERSLGDPSLELACDLAGGGKRRDRARSGSSCRRSRSSRYAAARRSPVPSEGLLRRCTP